MGCQQSMPRKKRRKGKKGKRRKSKSSKNTGKKRTGKPAQQQIVSSSNVSGTNNYNGQKAQDLGPGNLPTDYLVISQQNLPEEKHLIYHQNMPEEKQMINNDTIYGNMPKEKNENYAQSNISGYMPKDNRVIAHQNIISEKPPVRTNSTVSALKPNKGVPVHDNTGLEVVEAELNLGSEFKDPVNLKTSAGSPDRSGNIPRSTNPDQKGANYQNYHDAPVLIPSTNHQENMKSAKNPSSPCEAVSPTQVEEKVAHNYDDTSTPVASDSKGLPSNNLLQTEKEQGPLRREPEQISNEVKPAQVPGPHTNDKESTNLLLQPQRADSKKGAGIPSNMGADSATRIGYMAKSPVHQEQPAKYNDTHTPSRSKSGVVATTGILKMAQVSPHREQPTNHHDPWAPTWSKNGEHATTGIPYKDSIPAYSKQIIKHNDPYVPRQVPVTNVPQSTPYSESAVGNVCMDAQTGEYKFYQGGIFVGYVEKSEAVRVSSGWPFCNGTRSKLQNDGRFPRPTNAFSGRAHINQDPNVTLVYYSQPTYQPMTSYSNIPYRGQTVARPTPAYHGLYV